MREDDKVGRYKHTQLPFVGIACGHCLGQPGYGRYFPSTLPSFISSFPSTILRHFTKDCVGIPGEFKDLVTVLDKKSQRTDPLYHNGQTGTKGLMEHVWTKLRSSTEFDQQDKAALIQNTLASPIFRPNEGGDISWGDVLKNESALIGVEGISLVAHSTLVALHQFVPDYADEADCKAIGRNRPSIEPGFIGICCRFCQDDPKGQRSSGSRVFAASPSSLSPIATVNKLVNHIRRNKCGKVPDTISSTVDTLLRNEKSEPARYGGRTVFFKRLWNRLYSDTAIPPNDKLPFAVQKYTDDGLPPPLTVKAMIQGSELVKPGDMGMVSDSLLVAMAQLTPRLLTEADRSGWYKDREIGYPGIACKYCTGRASSGRYFPKAGDFFLRSSTQSIKKHLVDGCLMIPNKERETLIKLMHRDENRSG